MFGVVIKRQVNVYTYTKLNLHKVLVKTIDVIKH